MVYAFVKGLGHRAFLLPHRLAFRELPDQDRSPLLQELVDLGRQRRTEDDGVVPDIGTHHCHVRLRRGCLRHTALDPALGRLSCSRRWEDEGGSGSGHGDVDLRRRRGSNLKTTA